LSGFVPRQGQREILAFDGGAMGVSAVPGSGKTMTLAALAARLISQRIGEGGRILVVTYQNAAVDNIRSRIRSELEARNLLQTGYDVRTLHSLSYGLLHTYPGQAGVGADFNVLDERTATNLLEKSVRIWNNQNERVWGRLAPTEYYDDRWEQEWRKIAKNLTRAVIGTAKNRRLRPEALLDRVSAQHAEGADRFLRIGAEIYRIYQQQVETIGGLDFNDLVWLAVDLLERHTDIAARLRGRWPVVLEDEAQDSVPLQEELLGRLSGEGGAWVRVGDPNQSIMSTFTAADPRFLRRFLDRPEVQTVEMAISGRCAGRIIDLANHLVDWAGERHPLLAVRRRAFRMQYIRPTEAGDPQRNPADDQSDVAFRQYNNRQDEMRSIVRRAMEYAQKHPERTIGILVPTNRLGYEMAETLRQRGANFDEMLQSSRSSRQVTDTLGSVLSYLADPLHRGHLEATYNALRSTWPTPGGPGDPANVSLLLRSCYRPETLLFPAPGAKPQDALPPAGKRDPLDMEAIGVVAGLLRRWMRATALPVDQLLLTVAQDIMAEAELSRAQKLASHLRLIADQNPDWRLPELARELVQIARGRSGVLPADDEVFEPRPGRITLTTMHRAKGLEWDLVYLMGVDGRWFPSQLEDNFLGEYDFLGGDPAEEARAALLALDGEVDPDGMSATDAAHVEIIAERLRLLYVGITRARRYLAVSWSREIATATRMVPVQEALAFKQLKAFCDGS
jgi:DNA helicase II / ATP-dependent DNA helicase PcrA